MSVPITILVGQAGSGKDTVAGFLVKNHGAISIAQADPMKRLAQILFGFSEEQLWGPSEMRNAPDHAWDDAQMWPEVFMALSLENPGLMDWIRDMRLPFPENEVKSLREWVHSVRSQTLTVGKSLTPRLVLQTMGTEWGRKKDQGLWSEYSIGLAWQLLQGKFRYDRARGLIHDSDYAGPSRVVISDGRFRNEVLNVLRFGGQAIRIDSVTDAATVETAGVRGHASELEQKSIPTSFYTAVISNDKSLGLKYLESRVSSLYPIHY